MKKSIYIAMIMIFGYSTVSAQNLEDVVRFSRITPYGTARSTAMGGAFSALGGDISTLNTNPAGIGVFRKSDFSITPLLDFGKTKAGMEDEKTKMLMGNIGGVLSFAPYRSSWKNVNVGFSYTNMNNFNRRAHQYGGVNSHSMIDYWLYWANSSGLNPDQLRDNKDYFMEGLAYDAALINDNVNDSTNYHTPAIKGVDDDFKMIQERFFIQKGSQGEYAFSVGANYADQLYIGATFGIQSIHYKEYSTYQETTTEDSQTPLDYFRLYQDFESNGTGYNFKLGLIYKPIPELRLGVAVHTPTYYEMSAYGYSGLFSWFFVPPLSDNINSSFGNEAESSYDYKLKTPWRFMIGAAGVIGQRAILSADYEYVDYSSAKLEDYFPGEYTETNQDIKDLCRVGHNIRLGAEYRVNSIFSLRAGYSYQSSPFEPETLSKDFTIRTISGGFGLNFGALYTDMSYMNRYGKYVNDFYNDTSSPLITNKLSNNEFRVTFGLRF